MRVKKKRKTRQKKLIFLNKDSEISFDINIGFKVGRKFLVYI